MVRNIDDLGAFYGMRTNTCGRVLQGTQQRWRISAWHGGGGQLPADCGSAVAEGGLRSAAAAAGSAAGRTHINGSHMSCW